MRRHTHTAIVLTLLGSVLGSAACATRTAPPVVVRAQPAPAAVVPPAPALPAPAQAPVPAPEVAIAGAATPADGGLSATGAGRPLDSLLVTPAAPIPDPATAEQVAEDMAVTPHDIDIPLNDRVLGFIDVFTGRLKGFLEESLSRGAPYLPMIHRALAAEGLPTDLAFVPIVESAFNPDATSRAKARGLWQFMRGTAVENGLRHDWYVDERAEPERATLAAARYLKTLHDMFGDWHLALASYNGGPGRVQRAMKRSGKTDFWSLSANRRFLPRETRDYVPLILAAAVVGKNPTQYGLTIDPQTIEAPVFETVELTAPVDLRRLADAIERPVDEIKALNPALRRWATPPGVENYVLRIPAGTSARAAEFLASVDSERDSPYRWHTAKKGETVATVARRLKVTRRDLLDANFLKTGARLRPGQRLIVPKDPTGLVASAPRRADGTIAAVNTSTKRPAAVPASVTASSAKRPANRRAAASAAGPVVHRVKRGETLGSIARRYRTSVDDLRRWNGISGAAIKTGQRLTVRPRAAD